VALPPLSLCCPHSLCSVVLFRYLRVGSQLVSTFEGTKTSRSSLQFVQICGRVRSIIWE
jgi:hypothetical protein